MQNGSSLTWRMMGTMTSATPHYSRVRYPWEAVIDRGAPGPAAFYSSLIGQALRYGLPASRRFGPGLSFAARRRLWPRRAAAEVFRRLPGGARPEIDAIVESVVERWGELAEALGRSGSAPRFASLALKRSAALTVFVFADDEMFPVVVAKVAAPGDERAGAEAAALEEAAGARVGPKALGRSGHAWVQEGIEGHPLDVEPVAGSRVRDLRWGASNREVIDALVRLAAHTVRESPAPELTDDLIDVLSDTRLLSDRVMASVREAAEVARELRVSVLRQVDNSAQNCLFRADGSFAALVDWELARRGAPGFDAWNFALSYFEHCIGLVRWSEDELLTSFRDSWPGSPYWTGARDGARATMAAAAVDERFFDHLELLFFARRVLHRARAPERFPTSPELSVRMLDVVRSG